MKLNESKTKLMIFNFTLNYQFATRVYLNDSLLDIIHQTHLLGTVVSTDLTWHNNTQYMVKRGYQRMPMLRTLYEFDIPLEDLVMIYTMYIRSVLEYNLTVWFSSITILTKSFALKCVDSDRFSDMFPINPNNTDRRKKEKYLVKFDKYCLCLKTTTME